MNAAETQIATIATGGMRNRTSKAKANAPQAKSPGPSTAPDQTGVQNAAPGLAGYSWGSV